MSKSKLPIPLQSVTMSAEQYDELCDKISNAEKIENNLENFIKKLAENNVFIKTEVNIPFLNGFENIKVLVVNSFENPDGIKVTIGIS